MEQEKLNRLLAIAVSITSKAFETRFDKGGKPYILHCFIVMHKVRHLGTLYMIVAILHDLIEDTNWTYDLLRKKGFPEEVITPLELLDFRNKNYLEHIKVVAKNPIAKEIKKRDIEHNSKITRLKGFGIKDIDRSIKYQKAHHYLMNN